MAISPATVAAVIEIGTKLYEFIDKVSNKGEKGDQLEPIVAKLDQIKASINTMGETLRQELDAAQDAIVDDIRLTQQSRLPGAHAAVADYLRTHSDLTQPPDVNNPNYVSARTTTLDVKNYFLGHSELAFMGGFIQAMNARIEFITTLDQCWFSRSPEFAAEIREGLNHLNNYIGYVKSRINAGFTLKVTTKMTVIDPTTRPPLREPVSHTATVTDGVTVLFSKTVPATDDQPAAVRAEAGAVRSQASLARQSQVMGQYDQIAATWNALIGNAAVAAVKAALLPREQVTVAALPTLALTATASDPAAAAGPPELPLREVVLQVLDTPEFQQRNARLDGRAASFWFEKAFSRTPDAQQAATLAAVLELFGQKSFFRALLYSTEYENRWSAGVPATARPAGDLVTSAGS